MPDKHQEEGGRFDTVESQGDVGYVSYEGNPNKQSHKSSISVNFLFFVFPVVLVSV